MRSSALFAEFFFRAYCVRSAKNSVAAANFLMDAPNVGILAGQISLAKLQIKSLPRAAIVRESPPAHLFIGS